MNPVYEITKINLEIADKETEIKAAYAMIEKLKKERSDLQECLLEYTRHGKTLEELFGMEELQ